MEFAGRSSGRVLRLGDEAQILEGGTGRLESGVHSLSGTIVK